VGDGATDLVFFLLACLGVGMVTGASRATSLAGVTRESLKSFVGLAGGIALLCIALQLVQAIVQP
jgi:hypothetical protein